MKDTNNYLRHISDTHGVEGSTVLPDGTPVFAAYRDETYEICTPERQLTDTGKDLKLPQWLEGRETLLAELDSGGKEEQDLAEINPDTGNVSLLLDDEFQNENPQQCPTADNLIAFISNRDQSFDLYTLDVSSGEITRHSTVPKPVWAYAWSPSGDKMVYQAGGDRNTTLRVIDLGAGTDELLVDEPNSEQALSVIGAHRGRGAWGSDGILFTTNHQTGFREIAVADHSGDFEMRYVNECDKYDTRWTPEGEILFVETRGGNRQIRVLDDDGDVTVIEDTGAHRYRLPTEDGVYYSNYSPSEAGDLKLDGETVVCEKEIDVGTTAPSEVTYESIDGQKLSARLYSPEKEPVGAIVVIHGGPPMQHYNRLSPVTQTFVQAGFEVLAPDYRGSVGYGRSFRNASDGDMGGVDVDDIEAGAEYLRERGHENVAAYGRSYGGYLTLMAVSTTDAFDAGASICGIVNWESLMENSRGYLANIYARKLGGSPEDVPEMYEQRSPITHVDDIDVPLVVVQGANDPRIPKSEAEQLVDSIRNRDVDHEYLLFEDEGHGVVNTENRIEYINAIINLFSEQFTA